MNRRELLGGIGIAGASTALWALGCSAPQRVPTLADAEADRDEVRTWLRESVAVLASTFTSVHALAVERRRITAASDVFGTGIAREQRDGVVFTFRDKTGAWQEYAVSDLSRNGLRAAVRAMAGAVRPKKIEFGKAPPRPPVPKFIGENELRTRVQELDRRQVESRLVYNLALIDVEDTIVWSLAEGRDREHRSQRVLQRVVRAAWNGMRPVLGVVDRGWSGEVRDPARQLGDPDARRATDRALELLTPAAFPDGKHLVLLDPSVTASLIDAGTRALLTSAAARRPEIKRSLVLGTQVAAPTITLIDDPTIRGAYGAFELDDEGEAVTPVTLIDKGRLAGVLADRAGGGRGRGRRPGHIGPLEPSPSHLRLVPGALPHGEWNDDGFVIEGAAGAIVDPGTTRVVIAATRAREIRGGKPTGRVYADVELVGDLAMLFAAVTDTSSDTGAFAVRDERDGEPRWRSIEAPWLRIPLDGAKSPGVVRARRRFA